MSRCVLPRLFSAAVVAAAVLAGPPDAARAAARLAAAKPGAAALRAEVQAFVKSYVEAQNRLDASAMMEMMSRSPEVASITMGDLLRGWDAIRDEVDEMVAAGDDVRIALGTIEVVPLGTGHALAFAPCAIAISDAEGETQLRGALSLVLEKSGGRWKVLHEHASVQLPEDEEEDAPGPSEALPAARRG